MTSFGQFFGNFLISTNSKIALFRIHAIAAGREIVYFIKSMLFNFYKSRANSGDGKFIYMKNFCFHVFEKFGIVFDTNFKTLNFVIQPNLFIT
jgi:hypothetical protein